MESISTLKKEGDTLMEWVDMRPYAPQGSTWRLILKLADFWEDLHGGALGTILK